MIFVDLDQIIYLDEGDYYCSKAYSLPAYLGLTQNPKGQNALEVTLFAHCTGHLFSLYYACGKSSVLEEHGAGGLGCVWAAMVVSADYVLYEQCPLELCNQDDLKLVSGGLEEAHELW